MKKQILIATIAASLLAGAAAPAFAKDGKRGGDHRGGRGAIQLLQADANTDGNVTLDELLAKNAATFASLDSDNNASLTEDEFGLLREMRKAERDAARAERNAGNGDEQADNERRGRDGKRGGGRGMSGAFDRIDANNDDLISQQEFADVATRMFDRMDRNNDGNINIHDMGGRRSNR